jgi:murein DD-endopeptidase MepM/ murein hydrolase activator NlpD
MFSNKKSLFFLYLCVNNWSLFFLRYLESYQRLGSSCFRIFALLLVSTFTQLLAQPRNESARTYPKNYFTFPIMPGQHNFIVGNMGELRPNHFHSGLDIKTQSREGLPVYACAEGYVSRVKASTSGYGNVIYITHPNGLVTVYAHLRSFNRAIGDYMRRQQYARQTFELELTPQPNELSVLRGEIIASSGNTGSSGGPHLHFEIRDAKENVLNPLYFGFNEIVDRIPPAFEKIALRTLETEARVKGEFGRQEIITKKINPYTYVITQPITAFGQIGLEVLVHDKGNGVENRNGVSVVEVMVDGKEVYAHHLESFSFDLNRHLNVHTDYATGSRFQRCYIADGNALTVYKPLPGRGRLMIASGATHRVTVTLWDAYKNKSQLNFTIQGQEPKPTAFIAKLSKAAPTIRYSVEENALIVKARNIQAGAVAANLFVKRRQVTLASAYNKSGEITYLWDLRNGLPDSIKISGLSLVFPFRQLIRPQTDLTYNQDSLSISFEKTSLFDTLYLEVRRDRDEITINNPSTPLLSSITIGFKPKSSQWDQTKTLAYALKGRRLQCLGGGWTNGQLNFKTRELGTFTLATDTIPPNIVLVSKGPQQISFRIGDNLSGIASFRAEIDGKWLLMNYDHKRGLIWSEKPDKDAPLKGNFTLEVKDLSGNARLYATKIE